jgi:hypothetical protein
MKKLFTTQNKVFLYLLQSSLESDGIVCLIKNEQPPLAGEIGPDIAWPEIWVMQDEQFENALQILNEQRANFSKKQKGWKCANCNENNEGQFEICWNCGNNRTN